METQEMSGYLIGLASSSGLLVISSLTNAGGLQSIEGVAGVTVACVAGLH